MSKTIIPLIINDVAESEPEKESELICVIIDRDLSYISGENPTLITLTIQEAKAINRRLTEYLYLREMEHTTIGKNCG